MEYTELISRRESLSNYDPARPGPESVIRRILDAGRIAPSAHNNQPWKFILVSSPVLLEKVKMWYHREWIKDAPHILIVTGIRDEAWTREYDSYNSVETDTAIAMMHIILAAANEGVGTCWIMAYDPFAIKEALNLGEKYQIFGITPLGYPKPGYERKAVKKRKPLEEIVDFL